MRTDRDVLLALGVAVAAEVEVLALPVRPVAVAAPAALVACAGLAVRRRHPVLAVVAGVGALVVDALAGVPSDQASVPLVWVLVALWSAGRHASLRPALLGLGTGLGLFVATLAAHPDDLVFGSVVLTAPWLVGRALRASVSEAGAHARRADALARQGEQRAREAAARERARIARELHDVVSHSLTVMVVQAAAAAEVVPADPERARRAMLAVSDVGREALSEMAALLDVLRQDGPEVGLAPQPGLADLDALLERSRAVGVPVRLEVTGRRRGLPAGVELSVYRVVQEALTNTHKHARDAAAAVRVHLGEDEVVVEVRDDGTPTGTGAGSRSGIVGMRERVSAYGGHLEAGPAPGRGFLVRARVPLRAAP